MLWNFTTTFDGGDGNDTINGGTGDDKIKGGQGNDAIDGGTGAADVDFDIAYIENFMNIYFDGKERALVIDGDGLDTLRNVEAFALLNPSPFETYIPVSHKWGPSKELGTGAVVSWSLMSAGGQPLSQFTATRSGALSESIDGNTGYEGIIDLAFSQWAGAANIQFEKRSLNDSTADIKIYLTKQESFGKPTILGQTSPLTYIEPFDKSNYSRLGGLTVENDGGDIVLASDPGVGLFGTVALHEIGHAIGLEHIVPESPTYSIMQSDVGQLPLGAFELFSSDIAYVQLLYGTRSQVSSSGRASDGYLSGTTIFFDADRDGAVDSGEAATLTDQNGNYLIQGDGSALSAMGGVDISTRIEFGGLLLSLPSGVGQITPITTLFTLLARAGVDNASARIESAFRLPPVDFENTDPISAVLRGAPELYVEGAKVYNTVSLVAGILSGITGRETAQISQTVFQVISNLIAAPGAAEPLDLTSDNIVSLILSDATSMLSASASTQTLQAMVDIITEVNGLVDGRSDALSGTDLLLAVAAIQRVAHGAATSAAAEVGKGVQSVSEFINFYSGQSLADAIDRARSELGDVDGTEVLNAPHSADDYFGTSENTPLTINLFRNDSDPDGDPLVVSRVNGSTYNAGEPIALSSGARFMIIGEGNAVYDPAEAFEFLTSGETGSDSFTYTISDGNGGGSTSTVNVSINGNNDFASISGASSGTVTEDATLSVGGILTVTDRDSGEAAFQTPASLDGTFGTFAFNSTSGDWVYTLSLFYSRGSVK